MPSEHINHDWDMPAHSEGSDTLYRWRVSAEERDVEEIDETLAEREALRNAMKRVRNLRESAQPLVAQSQIRRVRMYDDALAHGYDRIYRDTDENGNRRRRSIVDIQLNEMGREALGGYEDEADV